jgi:PAS domain S-box-containing protein
LGQEFLGVLIVVNRPTPFSSADVELLSLFATQAAIAIRNANLIDSLRDNERSYKTLFAIERRQAQERFLLERVGTALARELDLSTTLRTIVEAIAETFGYTQVSIYLRQGDVLKLQHQVGYDRVIAEIPVTQGVSGRVVRTGQPILIKDVSTDPDFLGAIEGLVSEICVPLFDQDKVVGFFNIEGTHEVTLDEADLRLMIALSEHISLAINRARLYTEAKENEERFRQLAENIEDVFWMTNLDGAETIYVSPAFEELWGFSRQRMFEQPTAWMENLHPKDLERVIASFKERDLTQPDLKEYRLVRPDGSIRWVRDRAFPVRNESGQIYRRAGIIEDITARKQAEQQLAESEKRYRIISDLTSDYAYAFHGGLNGCFELAWASDAFTRITGFTAAEVATYEDWLNLIHPDDAPSIYHRRELVLLDGQLEVSEFRIVTKEGETRWLRDHIRPIWDEAQERVISLYGAAQDITERKQAEKALQESEQRYRELAEQNARLLDQARQDAETKAMLLQEVNHRVKNNLATIIGLLYAERRHSGIEDQAIFQEIMQDLINRVQGLATVHSLLSAAEWAPLSLSELAHQIIASVLQILPADKHIAIQVTPSPVRVTPQQANNLALVINELTTNTVKYALSEKQTVSIAIRIAREGSLILFEFRNSGPDYPPQVLSLERHNVGIYLMQTIVRKGLRGDLTLRNDGGAVALIRFPALIEESVGSLSSHER